LALQSYILLPFTSNSEAGSKPIQNGIAITAIGIVIEAKLLEMLIHVILVLRIGEDIFLHLEFVQQE
jgi:hypothetical protein